MLGRLVLVALAFAFLLAPVATATVPAVSDPTSDIVMSHGAYDPAAHAYCGSTDPLTYLVSTDLTSRMTTSSASGVTTFTVHLDATLPDVVSGLPGCGAIDITFTSSLAWPPASPGWSYASFAAACGLTGTVTAYHATTETYVSLYFGPAPAACGLPVSEGEIVWSLTPLHPSTAAACTPVLVPACAGAYSETYRGYGCNGRDATYFHVAVVLDLATVSRACDWRDGREHVVLSDGLGIVQVDTTSDSCNVNVNDPIGIAGTTTEPCPEPVRDTVYGTDWGHLLP